MHGKQAEAEATKARADDAEQALAQAREQQTANETRLKEAQAEVEATKARAEPRQRSET